MMDDRVLGHLRAIADLPDLAGTKYEVLDELGRGGMGTIYAARDTELAREVALKVLNIADPNGDFERRLLAEARHLARLEHPSIVPVHDVGKLPDGRLFYVMKLVRGENLSQWRRRETPLPALLRLFQNICEALAFAHAQGVIHRDLKPENIMVGSFGEALVMDWGVAKQLRPARAEAAGSPGGGGDPAAGTAQGTWPRGTTGAGEVIGTPAYMPPEQALGRVERVDERSDVYGLGAILYFLLSGKAPFEGGSAREVLSRVTASRPVPLRQIDSRIPRSLEAICRKAMAADPEGRYESARAIADDVDRYLGGLPVAAHPENILEKAARVMGRNRGLVLLLAAYLVMRALVLILTGR